MSKKDETVQPLVRFDEHGTFELTPELAAQVGAGITQPPLLTNLRKRVHDTLNPGNNHLCLSYDVVCGQNGLCHKNLPCL